MADDRTERFRPVFEPEDIFDRFVKNANASSEVPLRREDEPTGQVPHERRAETPAAPAEPPAPPSAAQSTEPSVAPPAERPTSRPPRARGGPPTWDHEVTVKAPYDEEEGTRPDAPMPIAMARAFGPDEVTVIAPDTAASPVALVDDDDDDEDQDLLTVPRASPLTTDSGQRIVLLTRVKPKSQPPIPLDENEPTPLIGSLRRLRVPAPTQEPTAPAMEAELYAARLASVASPREVDAQRAEAAELVPDLEAAAARETTYVGEGVEDGQMPTRQLDQILSDMAVLLRYGHADQVRERLDDLRRTYPEDLLLLRRLAEFHVQHEQTDDALETLFALAGGLFERRNVEGMRQVLEQVQTLDADNPRALRLLGLLEQRPQ